MGSEVLPTRTTTNSPTARAAGGGSIIRFILRFTHPRSVLQLSVTINTISYSVGGPSARATVTCRGWHCWWHGWRRWRASFRCFGPCPAVTAQITKSMALDSSVCRTDAAGRVIAPTHDVMILQHDWCADFIGPRTRVRGCEVPRGVWLPGHRDHRGSHDDCGAEHDTDICDLPTLWTLGKKECHASAYDRDQVIGEFVSDAKEGMGPCRHDT